MARRRIVVQEDVDVERERAEVDEELPSIFGDDVPSSKRNPKMRELQAIADEFKSFKPAAEVLSRVVAVPTIFPQFDFATRVGGCPTERVVLMHGPSGEGKTYCTIGLLLSFLMRNHFGALIDAERTTPITWLRAAMGEYADHPWFKADRPDTYEATVQQVRTFVNTVKKLRDSKRIPPETSALLVVDSIRKLVPEDIFKKITQANKAKPGDKKEKIRDRSAQIKAAMNSAWMDELIPLLEKTRTTMIIIAREMEDPDADKSRIKFTGPQFKVGGGRALYYDASLVLRVERAKHITKSNENEDGSFAKSDVYGERHRITIRKTKVAGQEDKQTVCHFHTSNGRLVPLGFDRARDVLELAERFDILTKSGGWLKWGRHKWQGDHAAVKKLSSSPDVLADLEAAVRERFDNATPDEA